MSTAAAPGSPTDMITCPSCRSSFPLTAATAEAAATPAGPGTMTILPPEGAAEPAPPISPTPEGHPGRLGRFAIVRYLGEGAFGRVYEALDPLLKRTVALKVAKPEQLQSPKRIERFGREARAAANLLHPNIVAVFDSGSEGAYHFIASAFVSGRPLAAVMEEMPRGKTLDVRESVQAVRKLAEALGYAHKQGVIHRDVKPGNVMLRDDGEPLLMDFGLAARLDETEKLTVAGQFMGTPEYTAPEQWRGQAEAASDQYSLGVLLFELLTGERPFCGASSEHYLMLHTQQAAPSPRKYRSDLPLELEAICLKCLEKEPARRYSDCQALADDLRRWLEGEAVTARRPGTAERLMRWTRRNPAVVASLVALFLLLAACLTTALAVKASNEADRANESAAQAQQEANRADDEAKAVRRLEKEARRLAQEEEKARRRAEINETAAKSASRQAEQARHAFQMMAALQAWQQNDLITAESVLDGAPPSMQQTWEYRHLRGLCRRKAMSLTGHTRPVRSVSYSPDGKRIVSGSGDSTVKVWDAQSGQHLLSLSGHTDSVTSVSYSPDGKRIVSGSEDKTVKVWDAQSGQNLLSLSGHTGYVTSVSYSPDGKRIVSGSVDKTVKVWDAQSGQNLLSLSGHTGSVTSVSYSPDGKRIVSEDIIGNVLVWDARSGKRLSDAVAPLPPGGMVAVRGDRRVFADGNLVRIERIPTAEERAEEQRIAAIVRRREMREYHEAEAETATMRRQFFAAVFHLDRLLPLLPDERRQLLDKRAAVLTDALKANPNDSWASRTLVRQAIADPLSVPEAALLVLKEALAKAPQAPLDTLYGVILLRSGATREAILVLRAALRNRAGDAPPVEELLLALAHIQREQPGEARKFVKTASAWMDLGRQAVRAASLIGVRSGGPLAALGPATLTPAHPRLDYATAHELASLRAEVERALPRDKP